jgi:hypothetical protein
LENECIHNKKKDKKAKEASDKAIMASVTEEMAEPRMSKSASIETDKQNHARNAKPE